MTNLSELNMEELSSILDQIEAQDNELRAQREEIHKAIEVITEREYEEEMASVDYAEKQKKIELISQKIDQAMTLIRECEDLAKEADYQFCFKVDYGMGGMYGRTVERDEIKWGWHASSHRC